MNPRCAVLLREALDLPDAERRQFLEQASKGDAALLATLLHLLELDAQADSFLDATLDEVIVALLSEDADLDELKGPVAPGDRVGPWHIIRKLGAGGMGTVWLAERADGAYSQQVALKTIKLGMDSAGVMAQFRRERNLMALLQHANIASLIDGGVDAMGRPWFAMEHVQGLGLRDWIAGQPPLRARLHLFEKLCRAVAHAHQQLVIHRDIKPGNVLVQDGDEPKLLDFGIAKLLADEDGAQTATLHRFASRSYAAPEQLRGDPVSTATDVYALGALLFEMLTGVRYASARGSNISPTRPSQVARGAAAVHAVSSGMLRGDLDGIVTRALAEEPARRYASALSVAEDVENYLSGRAVKARPDSAWYRFRKLVTRNRIASAALVLALLALVAGLLISVRQTARAEHQAQRAVAVTAYLSSLFDAGRSNSGGIQVRDRTVAELLEDSASHLRGELETQPDVRDELYTILIEIFDSNDQPERSLTLARERVKSAEAAWGTNDPRVAPALTLLVGVLMNHGKLEETPAILQRAEILLDAANDHSSLSRAQLLRWQGYYIYLIEDHPVYTGNPMLEAVALLRSRYADNDELLAILSQLAALAIADERYAEAQDAIDELRQRATVRYGNYSMYSPVADFTEASLSLTRGDPEKAYAIASRGAAAVRQFQGDHHHDVLILERLRIMALLKLQRVEEARALWSKADLQRQRDWPHDEDLRAVFAGLAEQLPGPI